MSDTVTKEGWAMPGLAKKFHYFRKSRSLCGRWMFSPLGLLPDDGKGLDDCVACRRQLEKEDA